ncbi:N-acetylmuramic acid 6-phosphate etherase [Spiroplasma endosymbiont of Anurida maritima]|uniref:N-acetylmuramic acid 6-phosphate etherase n=1 Tax=Spiroplasma endosymbiont of Anurida maritima TaxID=2967972 RepID=UPI0036D34C6A
MKKIELKNIATEQRNSNSNNLDTKNTKEILEVINKEDAKITNAINAAMPKIIEATDTIFESVKNKGRIFYLGAGSSGRIGVLDASEMLPTYGIGDMFYGIIAGGDIALRVPVEGAEDSKELAIEDLKNVNFTKNDIIFVIGASGRTPYCIGAMEYAKSIEAKSIALCMTSNSEFKQVADICIEVLVGPEVVTGSTRMKSGTATKMVLNMISTTTMIKLGKVYDNLMVDVQTTNEKLVSRAINIVKEITKINDEKLIFSKLKDCNMNVKLTIICLLKKVTLDVAQKMLDNSQQVLRGALQ